MKNSLLTVALFSALLVPLHAQEIRYAEDPSCGCDIIYVDGIETTRDGDLYGFRRDDGRVIVPNIYRYVDQFHGAYCRVWADDTLCGLIDSSGREILPCIYSDVNYPADGRIRLSLGKLTGYADLQGNIAIPPQYVGGADFSCHFAPVAVIVDSFFVYSTFIDTLGRRPFPLYENVGLFSDGFAPVLRYQRWGIIDTLGREIIPTVHEFMTPTYHRLFLAGDNQGLALYKLPSASPLTKPIYQTATSYSEGRLCVLRNGKYGFLDSLGNEVIPCRFDNVGDFQHGRTYARIDSLWGIIDTLGREILPIEYHNRTPKGEKYIYYDSLALVERNGRLAYVDLDGHFVTPFHFEEAFQFSQGLAAIRHEGHWGYIDTHGDLYLPLIFDIASPFEWGRAEVYFNGNPYKIDLKGRCVRHCNGIMSFR